MPIFLRFNNYIKFIKFSYKVINLKFPNMQNSIETRGNLCTELGWPVISVVEGGLLLNKPLSLKNQT